MVSPLLEQIVAGQAPEPLRIRVDQYHRMLEEGILAEGEAVELIEGILVRKDRRSEVEGPMTHSPRHAWIVTRARRLDGRLAGHGCHVRVQVPVTLSDVDEPEPDIAIVRGVEDDYADRHPGPADVIAVIEIAESSLIYDRTTKLRAYAAAGIPNYWIADLVHGRIEAYREPDPASKAFAKVTVLEANLDLHLALPDGIDLVIPASDLLPKSGTA